ncbi:MFS transporter [Marinobacteraceae bacterium S3BR75-40.1]
MSQWIENEALQHEHSQFALLRARRFLPFFLTQFAGAFNDNLYKNALMLLIVYAGAPILGMNDALLLNLAAMLFILPFFLFSAFAGQWADRYEKSGIIRMIKLAEVAIMGAAALGLWFERYEVLLLLLFLMGTQSAFFGPVKYALLPQALRNHELVGGNALVEMGTFVSILLGTIVAGLLAGLDGARYWVAIAVVLMAVLGYLASRQIPELPAADPTLELRFSPWKETWKLVGLARDNQAVFLSIMAISWFWFLGAAYLTQFPKFGAETLGGTEGAVTVLLAVFTLGIGGGSLLCEKLSRHRVELGIVPIGAAGLSLFGIDLYASIPATAPDSPVSPWRMLTEPVYLRMLADLLAIGVFGGFFIVPLYAYVQQETPANRRARIIAANNILNALFMVASAVMGMLFLGLMGLSIPVFFLVLAIMNIVVAAYVFNQVPEFALRFVIWVLSHTIYRVRHQNLDRIPDVGPVVLVCNHVSYMDALVIAGAVRRPVRFVMDDRIFQSRLLGWFFRLARTIPIAPQKYKPEVYEQAFESISQALGEGEVVCIFPEGQLTTSGEVETFKSGIETIVQRDPVPVVPMALQGLWGSFFSHREGPAFSRLPRRFWSRIGLVVGQPWSPSAVTAKGLEDEVRALRGDWA